MPAPQAPTREAIAAHLPAAIARNDIMAICEIGAEAHRFGMEAESAVALDAAVAEILGFIGAGEVDKALAAEMLIYQAFVRAYEDEDHYERVFSRWREPLAALGRRYAVPLAAPRGRGIGFVVASGVILGHTEVLLRLLGSRGPQVDARIYVYGPCNADFVEASRRIGVPIEVFREPPRWGNAQSGHLPRFQWLREKLHADGVATAVWVSLPTTAIFAMAMRLAPVQAFWTLRYHPVRVPEIDGYLTYGSWQETERVFHGQRWTVCPVPLALDPRVPPPAKVAELRARFPQKVLLGTLAREEKIDSRAFLESVVAILKRHPECGYVWTGRSRHAGIDEFFRLQGVHDRCHFVGWVDTPLYASILDLFLETFPLGCGITGYQALSAGVPLLSFALPNTVFGMQYWKELMDKSGDGKDVTREMLDSYPVLAARDGAEYATLALRLLEDTAYRDQWKARESRFFAEEIAGIARYSERFFAAIGDITQRTLAR